MRPGDAELRPLVGEARQVPDEVVRRVDRQQLATFSACLRMKRADLPTPHIAA